MNDTAPIVVGVYGDTTDIQASLASVASSMKALTAGINQSNTHLQGINSSFDSSSRAAKNFGAESSKATDRAGNGMKDLAIKVGKVYIAYRAVKGLLSGITGIFSEALKAEELETQFATLLGSTEAAKQRFEELAEFGAKTPFELSEIGQVSKMLQSLTQGALASGDGLRLVGDAAAALDPKKFQEIGLHIGRLYNNLRNGGGGGRSLFQLQQMGVITAETANELEKMQEKGAEGEQVWGALEESLKQYSGAMDDLSKVGVGKISNLADAWAILQMKFGRPLNDAILKPLVQATINILEKAIPIAERVAKRIASVTHTIVAMVKTMHAMFQNGELGEFLFTSLRLGFQRGVAFFAESLSSVLDFMAKMLLQNFKDLGSKEVWMNLINILGGLGGLLLSAAIDFNTSLIEGARKFIQPIVTGISWVIQKLTSGFLAVSTAFTGALKKGIGVVLEKAAELPGISDKLGDVGREMQKEGASDIEESDAHALTALTKSFADVDKEVGVMMDSFIKDSRDLADVLSTGSMSAFSKGLMNQLEHIGDTRGPLVSELFESLKSIDISHIGAEEQAKLNRMLSKYSQFFERDESSAEEDSKKKGLSPGGVTGASAIADSLAAIGGGGGIFGGGDTIASSQLAEQKRANEILDRQHRTSMEMLKLMQGGGTLTVEVA